MATISVTSRLLYYDVGKDELKVIIKAARILFGRYMTMKVKGTFEDRHGEIAFLNNDMHEVDLSRLASLKAYLPVKVDGKVEILLIPMSIDALLIESTL